MADDYVVNWPLAIVPGGEGIGDLYLYRGATVPDGLNPERVKSLVADGAIVSRSEFDKLEAKTGPDGIVPDESDTASPSDSGDGLNADGKPTSRTSKAQLVDYAESQGMSRDEADGMSKAQLQDKYVS